MSVSKGKLDKATIDSIIEKLEESEVLVPASLKEKASEIDIALSHILIDHLYTVVLHDLRTVGKELVSLRDKKTMKFNDVRLQMVSDTIDGMVGAIEFLIDDKVSVPNVPNVKELDGIFKKLKEEIKAAIELEYIEAITEGAPLQ